MTKGRDSYKDTNGNSKNRGGTDGQQQQQHHLDDSRNANYLSRAGDAISWATFKPLIMFFVFSLVLKLIYQHSPRTLSELGFLRKTSSGIATTREAVRNRVGASVIQDPATVFGELEFDPEDANPFNKIAMITCIIICVVVYPLLML